jgi:hypothetical protein
MPVRAKSRRDSEFSKKTIDQLRDEVGNHCSLCDRPTSGPSREPGKRTNVGTAAHITAAARGGPRFDENLAPAQRRSRENGIWCCRDCGKLVDDDASTYTVAELQDKKRKAIDLAHERVTKGRVVPKPTIDLGAVGVRWDAELAAMEKLYADLGNIADKMPSDVWRTYQYAAKVWDGWDTPIWTTYKRQLTKAYGDREWWPETAILYKRWNEARSAFRGRRRSGDLVTAHAAFAKRDEALDAIEYVRRCIAMEAGVTPVEPS